MMDPVGTVMAIFEIFDAIKTQIETVIANRNQCRLLASRIESLHLTLKAFFSISPAATPSKDDLARKLQSEQLKPQAASLTRCLARLFDVLSNAATLLRKFRGLSDSDAASGSSKQQRKKKHSLLARARRMCQAGSFQSAFARSHRELSASILELSLVLQLEARFVPNTDLMHWIEQESLAFEKDRVALRTDLQELTKMCAEAKASADARNDEFRQLYQADLQVFQGLVASFARLANSPAPAASSESPGGSEGLRLDPNLQTPIFTVQIKHLISSASSPSSRSIVYSGTWHGQPVAVKYFRPDHLEVEGYTFQARKRFLREATVTSAIRCANTVAVMAACHEKEPLERCFLILEHMPGGNLFDRITRDGSPDPRWALAMARDIAAALHHLHAVGFWHRNLTSHHVLLSAHGTAKLCDFSRAKDLRSGFGVKPVVSLTPHRDEPPGKWPVYDALKLRWMPPELFNYPGCYKHSSATSDVYGFGVVLYELFAGCHPFASFTVPHALLAKLSLCASMEPDTTFTAAHPLAPRHDWPSFIPQLIRDCTHKHPGSRPSVSEVLEVFAPETSAFATPPRSGTPAQGSSTEGEVSAAASSPSPPPTAQSSEHAKSSERPDLPWSPWASIYAHAAAAEASGNSVLAQQLFEAVMLSNDLVYSPRACADLGLLLLRQNVDYPRGIRLLESAAKTGHVRSRLGLVKFLSKGSPDGKCLPDLERAQHILTALEATLSQLSEGQQHLVHDLRRRISGPLTSSSHPKK